MSDQTVAWRLNRIMYPVYNLGPGKRIGLWVQGCTLRCTGCVSKTLWSSRGGQDIAVEGLAAWIAEQQHSYDGVTVTGGEPFEQYEALITFAALMKRLTALDIYVFSGYYLRELEETYPDRLFMRYLDYLVDGRYEEHLHDERNVRGSSNQTLYRFRDGEPIEAEMWPGSARWSLAVSESGQVFMAGIPRKGELQGLSRDLRNQGIPLTFL